MHFIVISMKRLLFLFYCLMTLLSSGCIQKEPLPEPEPDLELEAVDMGLSVKWGSYNVGASRPEDYGNYYAWGEIYPKAEYDFSNYFFYDVEYKCLIKYCTDNNYGFVDNKTVLEPMDDVASVTLGGNWRMPTGAEWKELADTTNCIWVLTTKKEVKGYTVTSKKTSNQLFFPLGGGFDGASAEKGVYGRYWSSSLYEDHPLTAIYYSLFSQSSSSPSGSPYYRRCGYSIRPVSK